MPELAEVEVVRRNLERWWKGRTAAEVQLHDPELVTTGTPEGLVEALGLPAAAIDRRGKYLIVTLATDDDTPDRIVVFHFRMTGKIVCVEDAEPSYARLAWHVPAAGWLVFKDMRRLGDAHLLEAGELEDFEPIASLGPEPDELSADALRERLAGSSRRLKSALLDQSVVAGIGNIAVSELFWRLELPPKISCDELDDAQYEDLVDEMPRYFNWLVEDQMSDEIVYLGEGKSHHPFDVYAREGEACPRDSCDATIERATFGGRSTYFCPACQSG